MVRDVLVMEIPTVLRTELYAVAALLGAAFTVGGQRLGMSSHLAAPLGAVLCIALRLLALRYGWHLPIARVKAISASEGKDQVGRPQEVKREAFESFNEGDSPRVDSPQVGDVHSDLRAAMSLYPVSAQADRR